MPASTRVALARRSDAITSAPISLGRPTMTALEPSFRIRTPIRFSSATCMNRSGKTRSVTTLIPSAVDSTAEICA